MFFQFLLGAVNLRLVENARFANADFFQGLGQLIFIEFLDAGKLDGGNRRPLFHHDHQHVAFRLDPDILEETGCVQRLDRRCTFFVGEGFTDAHRQVAENSACLGPLNTFNADILDHKRLHRERLAGTHGKGCSSNQTTGKNRQREVLRM